MELFLYFFWVALLWGPCLAEDRLLFAQVVWRHGDRAPIKTYPTDEHGESAWNFGFGELTELGMSQQLNLGRLLRKLYITNDTHLLSSRYSPKEVYIRSTDVNRTLLSALANTAGMFPAGRAGHDFPDHQNWPHHFTPVPVHTVPESTDYIGNIQADCPRADELNDEIYSSKEFKDSAAEFHDFFDYASRHAGKEYNLKNVYDLNDINYIESIYNMSQPSWMTRDFVDKMHNVTRIATEYYYGISRPYKPELIRLRGGNILKSLIDHMSLKLECLNSTSDGCTWMRNLKYYAYSAHDTTVAALLTTFGDEEKVVKGGLPHYTASVALELWDIEGVGPSVRVQYHKAFHRPYTVITRSVKGCPLDSDFCPFSVFVKRSKKFIPRDIQAECRPKGINSTKSRLFSK